MALGGRRGRRSEAWAYNPPSEAQQRSLRLKHGLPEPEEESPLVKQALESSQLPGPGRDPLAPPEDLPVSAKPLLPPEPPESQGVRRVPLVSRGPRLPRSLEQ